MVKPQFSRLLRMRLSRYKPLSTEHRKLAGEALIQAYCEGFEFEGYIFRFVSILGERYSHGHIFDFYRQLLQHPHRLEVLGDGTQRKSYLYIKDCIEAVLHVMPYRESDSAQRAHIYNLGAPEYCRVTDSIGWITQCLGLTPQLTLAVAAGDGWGTIHLSSRYDKNSKDWVARRADDL